MPLREWRITPTVTRRFGAALAGAQACPKDPRPGVAKRAVTGPCAARCIGSKIMPQNTCNTHAERTVAPPLPVIVLTRALCTAFVTLCKVQCHRLLPQVWVPALPEVAFGQRAAGGLARASFRKRGSLTSPLADCMTMQGPASAAEETFRSITITVNTGKWHSSTPLRASKLQLEGERAGLSSPALGRSEV